MYFIALAQENEEMRDNMKQSSKHHNPLPLVGKVDRRQNGKVSATDIHSYEFACHLHM